MKDMHGNELNVGDLFFVGEIPLDLSKEDQEMFRASSKCEFEGEENGLIVGRLVNRMGMVKVKPERTRKCQR